MAKNMTLTCSLCAQFCPNKMICTVNGEKRRKEDSTYADTCFKEGTFVRYMYILPEADCFKNSQDHLNGLYGIPKDKNGKPLIVETKRGMERAIPADPSVPLEVDPILDSVSLIKTYQGQRELIYELGVEQASLMAQSAGVSLNVLPKELGYVGERQCTPKQKDKTNKAWMTDTPIIWN